MEYFFEPFYRPSTKGTPARRDSVSSTTSSAYAESIASSSVQETSSRSPSPDAKPERRTTTQLRDYRPRSTLHERLHSVWDVRSPQELVCYLALMKEDYYHVQPEGGSKRGPMPYKSLIEDHAFILSRILVPMAIQQATFWAWPDYRWSGWAAYLLYSVSFQLFFINIIRRMDKFAAKLGVFEETVIGRDRTPDHSVHQLGGAVWTYLFYRPGLEFLLHFKGDEQPMNGFTWTFPLRIFVWMVVMDLLFYSYHRACHDVDALWFIHSKHHSTKHPSPVLAILSDIYQESLEIVLIPTLASLAVPMSFHELWVAVAYLGYQEVLGHSGIRAVWSSAVTGPPLSLVGADLVLEDHDRHHQLGRGGKNFGKTTRLWDVIFDTCTDRVETAGMCSRAL